MTISLCMIVKNESDTLGRCLDCFSNLFDEIVIIDTGSTDNTVEIARRYTDNVFQFQWIDDFSAARNASFARANCDYVMWLDADDVILPGEKEKLRAVIQKLDGKSKQIALKYDVAFDEAQNPTMSFYRERIFLRSANFQWSGRIHEAIPLLGTLYEEVHILHKKIHPTEKDRNLRIFLKILDSGEKLDTRQQFYFARELYYNGKYTEAIDAFETFLRATDALIADKISACADLSACYLFTDKQKAKQTLFRSFLYDVPRGEILCELGKQFFSEGKYLDAIYWYLSALQMQPDYVKGGFVYPDCYGYIPAIQLCVCYDRLGDIENAINYNERAAVLKPNSSAVRHNRSYFAERQSKKI